MTAPTPTPNAAPARTLPSTLRLGPVHLVVSDLDRSIAWYESALGLTLRRRDGETAAMGAGEADVLVLREDRAARRAGRHAGLYHYALLYPTREELARAAVRLSRTHTPIQGASDHQTHEAIYLPDPDGNGIELAADRPRDAWPPHLGYADGPQPLDFTALLATVAGEAPTERVAPGLAVGHLHLHVGDIDQGVAFYRDVLGFEVMAELGTAEFVSAGGYHHHLGFNVWLGRGVPPQPEGVVGLDHWTIVLDDPAQVDAVRGRVEEAGIAVEADAGGFVVRDPWRIAVRVVAATPADALASRAVVRTEKPSPYLLQVAKHFRHKLDVEFDDRRATIAFPSGRVVLRVDGPDALVLEATARTPEDLERVEQVVGSHLERFGRGDGLAVAFEPVTP